MGSIHPTDFIIYDFNKKRLQFEGLFQRPHEAITFYCAFCGVGINVQSYGTKSLPARKAVYAEFFGASMVVGVNYDSRFYENSRWGYRVGLSHTINELKEIGVCSCGGDNDGIYGFNVPLEINYLVGRRETRNDIT